jgi:hypothetical protein
MVLFRLRMIVDRNVKHIEMKEISGGAGEARTPDLRFRKPSLYPSELQPHFPTFYTEKVNL